MSAMRPHSNRERRRSSKSASSLGGRGLAALHIVADRMHEMSLAHSDSAIEEERVVGFGGPLSDGLCGGHGELIAAADDEGVELVARVQLGCGTPIEAGLFGHGAGERR